jgi:hypothetical protein
VAEWLKATALHGVVMRATASEVQILPLSAKFISKMKIAYLLFAYKNPKLIKKIVDFLADEDAAFFVHIDKKFAIEPFTTIRGKNVFFCEKRLPVYWAEISGVEAILLLIRQALATVPDYDYFFLLSGSEFPLRSRTYIKKFLEANRGCEFITMQKMPSPGKPLAHMNVLRFPSTRPFLRFIFRVLAKAGLARRDYKKYLDPMAPYSGFTWWTLSREACEYVLKFTDTHPEFVKFFQNVHAPEESYIHTILGNSVFKNRVRRNLLYEAWPPTGSRSPEMIGAGHLAFFESQNEVTLNDLHGPGEMLFARKFSDESLHLLERVEMMIEKKEKFSTLNAR